jgi:predicted transposase YdaD
MSGDHDLGYKQLFAHPELVRDLMVGFTPFACFRGIEPSAFERVNASYVSERFSERHGDMVWRVRLADHVVYVYLLLEFQSQAERWMALRMQVYVGLLYQDLVKRHELTTGALLPPVLPVVLYNGTTPWTASGDLRNLIAPGPSELDIFQASQCYLLIDQRSIDPAELENTQNLIAELFRLELSDSLDVLKNVFSTLAAWLRGEEQAPLRRSIAAWIERLLKREFRGLTLEEVEGMLEGKAMGERFTKRYASWADAIEDRGLQRGREEGLEKLRAALKRQLVRRFGSVPPLVAARIDQAAEVDIERWMDRFVDAGSIDAVLTAEE